MQLVSKFNQGIYFLLCVIDILSKYAWVIILKESNCKPSKIWVDKSSDFYNR